VPESGNGIDAEGGGMPMVDRHEAAGEAARLEVLIDIPRPAGGVRRAHQGDALGREELAQPAALGRAGAQAGVGVGCSSAERISFSNAAKSRSSSHGPSDTALPITSGRL